MSTLALTTATVTFPCLDPKKCNFKDTTRTGSSGVDFSVEVDDKISGLEFLRLIAQKTNCPISHQDVKIFEMKGVRSTQGGYLFDKITYNWQIKAAQNMKTVLNTFKNPYITLEIEYCHRNQCGSLTYAPSIFEEMTFGKEYRHTCTWANDLQKDLKQP